MPVDSNFDLMSRHARRHDHPYKQQHWPNMLPGDLRAGGIDAESLLEGTYDPYVSTATPTGSAAST